MIKLYKVEYKLKGKWHSWITVSYKADAECIAREGFKNVPRASAWRVVEFIQ